MEQYGKKAIILTVTILCIFRFSVAVAGNAVSETNAKFEVTTGNIDGSDTLTAAASISLPISHDFGLQLDGLAGEIDPDDTYGIGGHFFWRDPQTALLGVTASWVDTNNIEIIRTGLEAEYYVDNFTFSLLAGYQDGDINGSEYWALEGGYYLLEDLLLSASIGRSDTVDLYGAEIEYQTPYTGLSVFASAYGGSDNYDHYFGGIRYYLGSKKALADRHREDDPKNNLFQIITENIINIARMNAGGGMTQIDPPSLQL